MKVQLPELLDARTQIWMASSSRFGSSTHQQIMLTAFCPISAKNFTPFRLKSSPDRLDAPAGR
jgi:hypothetical protein